MTSINSSSCVISILCSLFFFYVYILGMLEQFDICDFWYQLTRSLPPDGKWIWENKGRPTGQPYHEWWGYKWLLAMMVVRWQVNSLTMEDKAISSTSHVAVLSVRGIMPLNTITLISCIRSSLNHLVGQSENRVMNQVVVVLLLLFCIILQGSSSAPIQLPRETITF